LEADREPVEVHGAPAPRKDSASTVLIDAGLEFIGELIQGP
jgi:hypothetical protein